MTRVASPSLVSAAWERRAADRWRRFGPVLSPVSRTVVDEVLVGPSGAHAVFHAAPGTVDLAGASEHLEARGCRSAAEEIASTLPRRHRQVDAVLVLDGTHEIGRDVDGVRVVSPDTWHHLTRRSPLRLSSSEVAQIGAWLERVLPPAPLPPRAGRRGRTGTIAAAGLVAGAAAALAWYAVHQGGWPF